MRKTVVSLLLVAMVVLSGCSGLLEEQSTPTESGEFSESIQLPNGGVAGEESVVEIELNNTGTEEREYDATLTADGEAVDEASVTVAGGESRTLSLSHTFEETGDHTLSVGNRSATITVYETPKAFIIAQKDTVETVSYQEETTFDGTVRTDGRTVESQVESSLAVSKNVTAETMYKTGTETTTAKGETSTESVQEWVVDGIEYSKSVDENGETTYDRDRSDEFDDNDADIDNESLQPYLTAAHTDEEYVFVLEADTSAEATELWRTLESLQDENSEILTAEEMKSLRFEFRFDRQTGHQTQEVLDVESSGGETFVELDMTITKSAYSYGERVTVDVPQDVKDGTSSSGTTDGSGTYAALAAGH